MIIPRDGEIEYKELRDLAFSYMFIAACLSADQHAKLKQEWEHQGGVKNKPWWQFVMEHVTIDINI